MNAVNAAVRFLLLVLILAVVTAIGTILKNRPPLMNEPGPFARAGIYLTTNSVETRSNAIRPELRPRLYDAPPDEAWAEARAVMEELGWDIVHVSEENYAIQAVAMTPLLRMKDDVYVRLHPVDTDLSTLYFHSRSRIGRADFAANTRHFLNFRDGLERRLLDARLSER
ncbi:DUF1499 domain-containing protein [Aquisalimonas asiatica]|uniref:Uncharacterized conserved protein, DUF1499 family n=1 Tax=Aquisalimonas asiatica TaxID=406100 RepID=A0A1H8Q9M6_9GAMM|nr:DUF1499 domain-containing protein [Aquisalimonas asiatica]SEO50728.1 Uncharacterized conserved protein, DUF1499 family [Aquisalimonas asiatica]